ncbi:hypothetical protein [Ancylobacter rudongensis]|uniref:Uncharacterized protein n=1 Tax=Ancylobacter rudongensis TaxID=177413 RepID=A0A1G4URC7_9HYPH|nr:hypothetical protein [Ancylobacter rudongensis]SCW95515.1 hypothetical protein SAMN05660859_0045 [Ancylobacter rudongensis]
MNRTLDTLAARAANDLDILEACKNHTVPPVAEKRRALADLVRKSGDSFRAAHEQSGVTLTEFLDLASTKLRDIRRGRAALAKERLARIEQAKLEREELMAGLAV